MNLEILNKNLLNTNWSNVRYEDGKLMADHNGELFYAIGNGRTNTYNGTTPCEIFPSAELYTSVKDFDFDQNGWVNKNLDFCPIGQRLNF